MPDMKELLGEELYKQVAEKAGDHKLAVVSDGNWFPKEKFDTVNNDNKELKNQIKQRDEQLKTLGDKAKGNEELTQQIEDLKKQNETTAQEYQQKLDQQAFDHALDKTLTEAKVKNTKAVKALLNTELIKLDGDTLLGLDEQLKVLKESDGYLFEDEGKLRGRTPNLDGKNPKTFEGKNPFARDTINLSEQARMLKEDPELAKQLQDEAKG